MKKLNQQFLILTIFLFTSLFSFGQELYCGNIPTYEFTLQSTFLDTPRTYWVSLPYKYSDTTNYPVVYVLDAEWRFDLANSVLYDFGGNNKLQKSIVVGIPNIDPVKQRGIDLTFSQTRTEYDGEAVDSTWYNSSNSGGAMKFYQFLVEELIPKINKDYTTNGDNTLIGHSYGGYFGAYLLSLDHPFTRMHLYDPSIWYSNGEVNSRLKQLNLKKKMDIFISYQEEPKFHFEKIQELIDLLKEQDSINLHTAFFPEESHNSLYVPSFFEGIQLTHPMPDLDGK